MTRNVLNSGQLSKKLSSALPDEYTTVAVDQTRKTVGCDLYHTWFPRGERVKLPFWEHSKEGVKLLGAVTEERELFATEVVDRFTSEITIRFLRALQDEFGEKSMSCWIMRRISNRNECKILSREQRSKRRTFREDRQT